MSEPGARQDTDEVSIIARLRSATQIIHQSVEAHIDLNRALATTQAYACFLKSFFGIFVALEPQTLAIDRLSEFLPDASQRSRVPLLLDDIKTTSPNDLSCTVCPDVPAVADVAEAFGCLYVLEGSTLGGKFISREVHQRLGFDGNKGCRFFTGGDRDTGQMWKEFRHRLEAFAKGHPERVDSLIGCAVSTFQSFEKWIVATSSGWR